MTSLLDQDVPDPIARVLQQAGHEVLRLRDHLPINASDRAMLTAAAACGAILVTCNRDDFLALAQDMAHAGIIVLVRRTTRIAECGRFLYLLQTAGESGLRKNINFA